MEFHIPFNVYLQKYRYKYAALYHAIRDALIDGKLQHGVKLPATRELAMNYEISRGIVNQVYEMLTAEGYLSSEIGRGTFVTYEAQQKEKNEQSLNCSIRLSNWGNRITQLNFASLSQTSSRIDKGISQINFKVGSPDLSSFPFQDWNRCLHAEIRQLSTESQAENCNTEGYFPLREAISRHLLKTRGVESNAENIAIVNGSMQAIALLTQLLINPKDKVIVENPCYTGIHRAIQTAGGTVLSMDIEKNGIQSDLKAWPSTKLAFLTPSRQYPTGVVLNLSKRQKILEWAHQNNTWIIEDDYDSEFRYKGRPIEPLKVLDHKDRVIYIGTFSKTLRPELRIGYVVLPKSLIRPFKLAKELYETHATGLMEQKTLTSFINQGLYDRHLRKMKRLYQNKQQTCLKLLKQSLSHLFSFIESDAGLHVYGKWLLSDEKYEHFKQKCAVSGVYWADSTALDIKNQQNSACFGFSHLSIEQIKLGIKLAAAASENLDSC
ncbi:MocR-like pyridoxine biosynthesis transcription factor PdxR [Chengkuizengella axinellae]|uniref:PLP-dependent aminotransferase family protein n=1 Tax=Chengkuizengella axinellae TaxID=3064388 RepID=A0ABT9J4J4_9BACL|nr:PLP-dependent aminotransferase family protein [Chengkuizengella sp. 2205SS18-9]MDP5275864.1 PLP-dependent aminotransferase family protein [Chengkuizengella sp. 2205SS18-9]